jgi:hypothetical protein
VAFRDVRVVRSVDWTEGAVAPDATLKFFLRLLGVRFFDPISAPAGEETADDNEESEGECLQAQTILKKLTSDK